MNTSPTSNLEIDLFVEEVQQHPCLYNKQLRTYRNKGAAEKAWGDIARAIKRPGKYLLLTYSILTISLLTIPV